MAGGDEFTKIDLRQAYLQLEVKPEDRHLLTLNTHEGLIRCTRLLYGVASAPAIWQRAIENVLQGIPEVAVFLGDIVITGESYVVHLDRLEKVFQRFTEFNIKLNVEKSFFFKGSIQYCGYIINNEGGHKDSQKLQAIKEMFRPVNITEFEY